MSGGGAAPLEWRFLFADVLVLLPLFEESDSVKHKRTKQELGETSENGEHFGIYEVQI